MILPPLDATPNYEVISIANASSKVILGSRWVGLLKSISDLI